MFTKQVFSALTIAGVLLLISAAIAGLKFGVLICTDRSNTVPSAVIMIRDTYDIFLLIIKPLFVLVFVCQFSPYINSKIIECIYLVYSTLSAMFFGFLIIVFDSVMHTWFRCGLSMVTFVLSGVPLWMFCWRQKW